MMIFTSINRWLSNGYSWVLQALASSDPYESGRQYAIEQLNDGVTLDRLEHDFEIHSGFYGMTPFDRGVQSVLFEKHRELYLAEKEALKEVSDNSAATDNFLNLCLTANEAKELLRCVEKGIHLLLLHQHTQELSPADTLWYTNKANVLMGIKQKLREMIVETNVTGHE